MLETLIVTLREGVEAALVIGIAVAYLNKSGRTELIRWVYGGLAAALVGSVALGIAFAKWKWNQDRFEGWVMLACAALVGSLVFMMWRGGGSMMSGVEAGVQKGFFSPAAGPGAGLGVVLGVLFGGGSVGVNLANFFRMTRVILSLVVFKLVVRGLHELAEKGVTPASKTEMAWIGPIARNEQFFIVAILALAAA